MKSLDIVRHLFSILLLLSTSFSLASVKDSVGVEKKGNLYFIKHQMDAGETLYALSKKYKVSVTEIKDANPNLNINDIGIGQIIYIPAKHYKGDIQTSTSAKQKTHKVQPKETLFGLSRKYGVSVNDLKKSNPQLEEKGLQIGQELIIPGSTDVQSSHPTRPEDKSPPRNAAKTETIAPKRKVSIPAELPVNNTKIEKITESGIAENAPVRIDGPDFYAYHKTAPVGTIIQVINEENGQRAFVRVLGAMQNPSSNTTLIQLSPKAMERIIASGNKTKVRLSYFMP